MVVYGDFFVALYIDASKEKHPETSVVQTLCSYDVTRDVRELSLIGFKDQVYCWFLHLLPNLAFLTLTDCGVLGDKYIIPSSVSSLHLQGTAVASSGSIQHLIAPNSNLRVLVLDYSTIDGLASNNHYVMICH